MFSEIFFWLIIAGGLTLFVGVMGPGYTDAAGTFGKRYALKSLAIFALFSVLYAMAVYVLKQMLSSKQFEILFIGGYVLVSCAIVILFAFWSLERRRIKPENVRINLGLDNRSGYLIVGGLLFSLVSIGSLFDYFGTPLPQVQAKDLTRDLCCLLLGLSSIFTGIRENLITDELIFLPNRSIRWINIQSYTWEGAKLPVLSLNLKGRRFLFHRVLLVIPHAKKLAVQELLDLKLAGSQTG